MKDFITKSPEWQNKEVLWQKDILGIGTIVAERRTRPDGSQITFTTLTNTDSSWAYPSLLLDDHFLKKGIATEPNGLLINQKGTAESWGLPAAEMPGIKPEDWLKKADDSLTPANAILGFPATNAFWQKGEFFVQNGKVLGLPDDNTLNGNFEMLAFSGGKWNVQNASLKDGRPQNNIDGVQIGMSMPMVVKDGLVVPQNKLIFDGHLRMLGDLRNAIDFSNGANKKPDFNSRYFDIIRKLQPSSMGASRALTFGNPEINSIYDAGGVVMSANLSEEEITTLTSIVNENTEIQDKVALLGNVGKDRSFAVSIEGPFPPNRIPVTLIGHDQDGNLIAGFFNGRQKESTGVTIDEAADIMKEKGAINAGLGVGGGDVALLLKQNKEIKILNSPSNKDNQTRNAPNMLTLTVPDSMASLSLY